MRFTFSRYRHGGWYVHEVRYPSGAIGCVSRNYDDGKWRIVCDPRPFEERLTYPSRAKAAQAEYQLAQAETRARPWRIETPFEDAWAQVGWPCATETEAFAEMDRLKARDTSPRAYRARNVLTCAPR